MQLERVVLIPALLLLGMTLACSGEDHPKGNSPGAAGDSSAAGGASNAGTSSASGDGNSGGAPDSAAGNAGTASTGGDVPPGGGKGGTTEPPVVCGNGVREPGEACDGDDLHGYACVDLGYASGSLTCTGTCTMDESDCVGTELCSDGLDNDGDRLVDCEDIDCEGACGASCTSPDVVVDVGTIHGALVGHATELDSRCSSTGTEPELVYSVTATTTGILEAVVVGAELKIISVRTSCDDGSTELNCSSSGQLEVPVEEGESYFVVIEGNVPDTLGEFELTLTTREIACGNLEREGAEECDDGNLNDGDGCNSTCEVELSESESNRSPRRANPYVSPFCGIISGELDRDYVWFDVAEPPAAILLNTLDFGDGACISSELDSVVTLFGSDGLAVLAEDDDSGPGYCSSLEYVPEAPAEGAFYVAVSASAWGASFEFPYILSVYVELCGNGVLSPGEGCDDGNRESLDGCSADCQREE